MREQDSEEVKAIIDFFDGSNAYRRWTDTRRRGTQNAEILGYFQGKERSYGNDRRSRDVVRRGRGLPAPDAPSPREYYGAPTARW